MSTQEQTPQELSNVSRRTFIKMVIASGAAVSASAYLFRGPTRYWARVRCPARWSV